MKKLSIPGFVDLQVNGYLGVSFSDPNLSEKQFIEVSRELLARGTAAFLPTLITSSPAVYERNLPLIAKAVGRAELSGRIPGIHLEGPFISDKPGAVGAHNPQFVSRPDTTFLDKLLGWSQGMLRLITIAAEADGADNLARHAVEKGVAVALGHQLATEEDLLRLENAGACLLTHLGNAVPNMLPRHPNPIWDGIASNLSAMIITDGHHLPPSVIKTIVRAKGAHNVVVTSDASPIAGMPPGEYEALGNKAILDPNGRLYNPEKNCLVGSSATILECMNFLAKLEILSWEELLLTGFHNPLRFLGMDVATVKADTKVICDEDQNTFTIGPA